MAWTAVLALRSPGAVLHDEVGHYLFSRYALAYPANILDTWGRAFQTLLYAVPAQGPLWVARLFSVLLAGAAAACAAGVARVLGAKRWFAVTPLLFFFQPWAGSVMFAVLTEVPFTLLLVAAAYCWITERYVLASLAFGLLPLTRHEGIVLAGAWGVFSLLRRDWRSATMTALPLAFYNALYWVVEGSPEIAIYFRPHHTAFYGRGGWLDLIRPLWSTIGTPVLALAAVGLWPVRRRLQFLAPALLYLATHVVLYRFGLFATGGYVEFLVPLAPFAAILAAHGGEWSEDQGERVLKRKWPDSPPFLKVGAATVLLVVVAFGLTRSAPRPLPADDAALLHASQWLDRQGLGTRPIVSTHVWFYYFHHQTVSPGHDWTLIPDPDTLAPGTVVVWDNRYSDRWGLTRARFAARPGAWRLLQVFGPDTAAAIFERSGRRQQ